MFVKFFIFRRLLRGYIGPIIQTVKNIEVKAILKKTSVGVVLEPATQADKVIFNNYVEQAEGKYISVDMRGMRATKTYDQLKAAWALISLIFESMYFRKPTAAERKQMHDDLIKEFAPRRKSLLHENETEPITMSEMSKEQLSCFIQSLIGFLSESCDLDNDGQLQVKQIFTEWENYKSTLDKDPDDYDENGEMLDIDTWREKHPVSFASGIGGPLDLAHIVSRGADEIHKDCCWNTMMLTHEEHMLQHAKGWNNFLELYPHLRGRVERARRIAGKLALLEAENNG